MEKNKEEINAWKIVNTFSWNLVEITSFLSLAGDGGLSCPHSGFICPDESGDSAPFPLHHF